MRARPLFLTVHRWLTFVMGLLFFLVIASGVVLLYADGVDATLNPGLYRVTAGDVGMDRARAAVVGAYPEHHVGNMYFPTESRPVYVGTLGATGRTVHVDPGSGEVLGDRHGSFVEAMRTMHIRLFAGSLGARLVGVVGLLLVMIVTGLYLWWPGLRKMSLGFRLRRRSGPYIVLYDLHNLAGVLSLPVVLLVTVTGIPMSFYGLTQSVVKAIGGGVAPPPLPAPRAAVPDSAWGADSARLTYAELVQRAQDTIPGTRPMRLSVGPNAAGPIELRMYTPDFPAPDGLARVMLDPYSGRVLRAIDPRTMSAAQAAQHHWFYALHVGSFSPALRALYAVFGAAPLFLIISGLLVWWNRRRGQLVLEERRQGRQRPLAA